MSTLKIKTDGKWKEFKDRFEVPKSVLEDRFDYLDEDTFDGFFKYHDIWYHTSEFMRFRGEGPWDGYAADGFTSGVLIELSDDGEEYRVGAYRVLTGPS